LDERRAKFKANLWNRPTKKESELGVMPNEPQQSPAQPLESKYSTASEKASTRTSSFPKLAYSSFIKSNGNGQTQKQREQSESDRKLDKMERLYSKKERLTDIEEVWFAVRSLVLFLAKGRSI
jgi:hypothetical protein